MHLSKSINKLTLDSLTSDNHNLQKSITNNSTLINSNDYYNPNDTNEILNFPSINIKNIDYEFLEKNYQIFKHYPSYIHNSNITTPDLRDLIVDKPIYNEANKHVKKKKKKRVKGGCGDLRESRRLRKERKEQRKELYNEQKEQLKEMKQEIKNLHNDQKQERKDFRQQQLVGSNIKKSYCGHYSKKINNINNANGGSNDIIQNSGQINPYQMKTQFSENTDNTMSRSNSQFTQTNDFNYDSETDEIDDFNNTGSNNKSLYKQQTNNNQNNNYNVGYDSEKTEVENEDDQFNPIFFNNPFEMGKKIPSTISMSKSSSFNNYTTTTTNNNNNNNNGYNYPSFNSRNNSINIPNNLNPLQPLHSNTTINGSKRRSSSITSINSSQNGSQNRYNNSNGNCASTTMTSIQPRRSTSIASKFMNMFTSTSHNSNNSNQNQNHNNTSDEDQQFNSEGSTENEEKLIIDDIGSFNSSGGGNGMNRKGSIINHKLNHQNNLQPFNSNGIQNQYQQQLPTYNQFKQHQPQQFESYPIQKSNTFDQTKSSKTTLKNKLKMKLTNESRRYSEQFEVVTENVTNGHTGEVQTIQYTQSQMVGHGSFGVVFQTQIMPTNEICAMKRVLQDKRFKNRELEIMKTVHHRNIADLKYFFYTNNDKNELYLNLILEFVPETLYKASHYYVSKRLNMPSLEIKLYTYQMFRALNYIHSMKICHRDIKPQNLLINPSTGELKLCDFGSAKKLSPDEPNVSYICSRYYRAPELIFGATNYTTKIDVWSAGCVMAELILGQPLFPGESGIDQLVEIIKILGTPSKDQIKNMNPNYMEHRFPQIKPIPLHKIFKKMNNDCIQFLIKVLQYSPIERINCIQAMIDPYFDELRNEQTKLPNYRKLFSQQFHHHHNSSNNNGSINGGHSNAAQYQLYNNQPDLKNLPELFDFDELELSVEPNLNHKLIPQWKQEQNQQQNHNQENYQQPPQQQQQAQQ